MVTQLQKSGPKNKRLTSKKFGQTGARISTQKDLDRFAVAPGYRYSKNGKWYFEGRKNRSDIPGTRL